MAEYIPTFLLPMFSTCYQIQADSDAKGRKGAENLKVAPILTTTKLLSECNMVNETTLCSATVL